MRARQIVQELSLSAVAMNSVVFWDIMPCSPLKAKRRVGGTCRLHLQCRRISRTRNQHETGKQAEPVLPFLLSV
jgi:hypothetical protein